MEANWRKAYLDECENLKNQNLIGEDIYSRLTNVILKVEPIKKRGRKQIYITDEERKQANREYNRRYYQRKKQNKETKSD